MGRLKGSITAWLPRTAENLRLEPPASIVITMRESVAKGVAILLLFYLDPPYRTEKEFASPILLPALRGVVGGH